MRNVQVVNPMILRVEEVNSSLTFVMCRREDHKDKSLTIVQLWAKLISETELTAVCYSQGMYKPCEKNWFYSLQAAHIIATVSHVWNSNVHALCKACISFIQA